MTLLKPTVCALLCALHTVPACAWRPLGSEEALANTKGHAHIETVWSRDVDGARYLTVIPSYTPLPGLELFAITNRNLTDGSLEQALQAKIIFIGQWQLRPCDGHALQQLDDDERFAKSRMDYPGVTMA